MQERRPAEVFPPGEFIREELDARGWTQLDLAEILGRPMALVNEVIAGKRGITPETAKGLANAFGTSAGYWLNLQTAYQVSQADNNDSGVVQRAQIYAKAPVRDMIRRGWIEQSNNPEVLEQRVLDFFGIESLQDDPPFWQHAARKATSYSEITPAQAAWLSRAKQLAGAVSASTYSAKSARSLAGSLGELLGEAEQVRHVPRLLAEAGVRLMVVEALPRTRIDGACFWMDAQSPVIALSMRYDRIDAFWFTLMHELGHVLHKDGFAANEPLDVDLFGEHPETLPDFEIAANKFAVETLIPQDRLEDFITRVSPLYAKKRIRAFANLLDIHPGIVVGQLQFRGEIGYSHSRDMLVGVRSTITGAALTDGWGQTLPAGL